MKPFTKFAAAAILLIAAFLSLTVFNKTVAPAYALEQVRNSMRNVLWMHCLPNMKVIPDVPDEIWLSPSLGIEASRMTNGQITFTDIQKKETTIYDPDQNTLTLSAMAQNTLHKAKTPAEFLDLLIDTLKENDNAQMTTKTDSMEGNQVAVYEITIPRGDPPGSVGTEIWRLSVDPKNHLLRRLELEGWDETGNFIKIGDGVYDYPKSGPMSIYDLGVPQSAAITDKRPSMDVAAVIERYEAAQKQDLAHYTALILHTRQENNHWIADEATIRFRNNNLYRTEQLSITENLQDTQRKGQLNLIDQMGDSLDSMMTWWTCSERLSRRLAEMFDGQYRHSICRSININQYQSAENTNRKTKTKASNSFCFYSGLVGVGDFFRFGKGLEITRIENDYSRQHGLIALEKLEKVDAKNRESIKYSTPHGRQYKRICYLDPQKDYICCRMVSYLIQDEIWQKVYPDAEKYYVSNPDPALEFTQREVRDITEYGQTASGKWYPKEIRWHTATQRQNGQTDEHTSIVKIYLDAESPIPEDTFTEEAFSTFLSQ